MILGYTSMVFILIIYFVQCVIAGNIGFNISSWQKHFLILHNIETKSNKRDPSERKETAFHLSWIDKDKQSLMVEF